MNDDALWSTPSKSRRKREHQAIQDLGLQLIAQSDKVLAKLDLDDELLELIQATRLLSKGARKRQLKYLGARLTQIDISALRSRLDDALKPERALINRFHDTERWRDALLGEGERAFKSFITEYPAADRQQLNQLIRNATRELAENKPPRAARGLFKFLANVLNEVD